MSGLKIILVSQKGGVGKSTLAANLAAWFCLEKGEKTGLLDFDPHGSSSSWVSGARPIGLTAVHNPIDESGARRWLLSARNALRRMTESHEVVIADLTWTPQVDAEFLLNFDLVLVPSGVSEIELAATVAFIERYRWVFAPSDPQAMAPGLVVCPSRIKEEHVSDHALTSVAFPVPFALSPPVFDDAAVRNLYRKDYIVAQHGSMREHFVRFAQGVQAAANLLLQQRAMKPPAFSAPKKIATYNGVLQRYLAERAEAGETSHSLASGPRSLKLVPPVQNPPSKSVSEPLSAKPGLIAKFLNSLERPSGSGR